MIELFWEYVRNFIFLSLFLLIAIIIKARVKFFQRYLIPTAIIGGLIGLILGPEVAKLINFSSDTLGILIYHLMAIGFISLAVKDRKKRAEEEKGNIVKTGISIVAAYLIQAIIGFGISLALAYTIFPGLFPPFGLLLPLGFGQGAGEAYSIGYSWEALGFVNGGNIGLSIAMIGLVWSIIPGIPLLNFLVRRKEKLGLAEVKNDQDINIEKITSITEKPEDSSTGGVKGKSIVVDKFTIQLALIGTIYLVTFYLLKGISALVSPLGDYGQTISQLLWGFHFVIATMLAIVAKMILNALNKRKWLKISYTDNYLLQRIADVSFDYMIVASIAAISIVILKENWIPILLITTVGGIVTMFFTVLVCKRIYKKNILEHIAVLYGTWTGTISTGVALLREIDTESKS